jgi:hypothetical protein
MPDASMSVDNFVRSAAAHTSAAADHPWPRTLTREIDCVPDADWEPITAAFDDLHYEQTACFAVAHWNSKPSHLLLRDGGVPVAGARLAIMTLPGFKTGLAFLRFGPFWQRKDRAPEIDIYRAAIAALVDEYCVRRGHCLTVIPRPHPDTYEQECQVLADYGFSIRRKPLDPNRYLVDVALDEDALMKSLEQKWRYNLRQALGNGLEIRLCESAEDLAIFKSLYATMVARKNFASPVPVHLVGDTTADLPAQLRPHLALAFHQGRPVVGATIGIFGNTAYYMYGASDDAALSLKGGYALHWWISRWLSAQGVRWYDLGGEAGEQGLRQFKKGLVGKRGKTVVVNGEYDYWTSTPGRVAADLIYGLRAAQRAYRDWRYGG